MYQRFRPTVAEVHLNRLSENFRILSSCVGPDGFFCAMVKCNAYGHGAPAVARRLESEGCKTLGVALVEEGVELREAGIQKAQILVFGTYSKSALSACAEFRLTPVISQLKDLAAWEQIVQQHKDSENKYKFDYHLELNTGMNRLGIRPDELQQWIAKQNTYKFAKLTGLFTHLSHGEDISQEHGESRRQLALLKEAYAQIQNRGQITPHIYASSGLIGKATSKEALWSVGARVGLALYGVKPAVSSGAELPLQQVVNFKTQVVAIQQVEAGVGVSYSATWRAERPALIAVLPVGYGDGYSRYLSNKGSVLIEGRRAAVVGNVCMDYIMCDVSELCAQPNCADPYALIGKEAVLWGWQGSNHLAIDQVATQVNTIAYTLLTELSPRVPREYIG